MAKQQVLERGARLVEALRARRESGAGYPTTVRRLREQAEPEGSDEDALKALAAKPAAEQVVLAARKDPEAPVALAEDAELLAASPLLAEYALGKVCSAEKPLHPVAKVAGKVDRGLQGAFAAALEGQAAGNNPPPGGRPQPRQGKP